MLCSQKHRHRSSSMVPECLLSFSQLRETGSPEEAQNNTCLLSIRLQPALEGILLPKSGASLPFISKDRDFWKQTYPSARSQAKSFPILEIQFSLGKPPSSERKLSRRFIIHKSFLGIGSLPVPTLLSVFSDFRMSIKNFNSWSLSE